MDKAQALTHSGNACVVELGSGSLHFFPVYGHITRFTHQGITPTGEGPYMGLVDSSSSPGLGSNYMLATSHCFLGSGWSTELILFHSDFIVLESYLISKPPSSRTRALWPM
jgi:hypothetical protein